MRSLAPPQRIRHAIAQLRAAIIVLLVAPAAVAYAQSASPGRDRLTIADYFNWETISNPQFSPDGQQILYSRGWIDQINDRRSSSVWLMNVDGTHNRSLLEGSGVVWSPDGTRIAYLAAGQPAGNQIWVRWMDAEGATSQITRLTESPAGIAWSPDGKSIAFSMRIPQRETVNLKLPPQAPGAKWVEPPRVVEKLHYRQDGSGFVLAGFTQLFVVSADGGSPRQITTGDWNHNGGTWTPDGKGLLFSGNLNPDPEYEFRESEIYRADVASGTITKLTKRRGPDANPTPSPDGRLIAYTGNDSTDATWQDQSLYVMNADGTSPRNLTASLDRSPGSLTWATDGTGIYFTAQNQGSSNLYFVTLTGQLRQVTTGTHMLSLSDMTKAGVFLGTRTTSMEPPNIITFDARAPQTMRTLTNSNSDLLAGKKLATTEEVWYTSVGGMRIQGWIVKPPDFDRTKKYPLMLEIHGGPHSMYNVAFNFARQDHAAYGYVILYTNPRGSTGYGSKFGNEIKNAYPGKDFDDLMAGVDTVIGRGYIDTNRLYVFGCSGGGVLTAWTVGHTNRFAAATSMCPVINWLSFVGNTDGQSWYHNFEKYFWDDPSEHLRRSPIMYVGNVRTPTQLMTGVNDLRTPMGQTEEFYEALKMLKIPTRMVRFNNEWHGTTSTPSNFVRTQAFLREWFERYTMPPGKAASTQQ